MKRALGFIVTHVKRSQEIISQLSEVTRERAYEYPATVRLVSKSNPGLLTNYLNLYDDETPLNPAIQ